MLGKGNTAEVFECEHGKVCKLFFEGYPQQYVEHEYQNAKEVFRLKLKTPEPFGLVTINQRNGIIYERVDGEPLLNHRQNTNIDELLDMFTQMHYEWLGNHSSNVLLVRLSDGVPIVIDFMNVCYGPALYDMARTFFLLNQVNSSIANKYLKKMNVSVIDIAPYVNVIKQCRKYETALASILPFRFTK